MPTFRISTWETEYKRCYIDATTKEDAQKIANESLHGERSDVTWDIFDRDLGTLEETEEI